MPAKTKAVTKPAKAVAPKESKVAKKVAKPAPKAKAKDVAPKKGGSTKKEVEKKTETTVNKIRHFKILEDGEKTGRFAGKKPKQAANKVLTSLIKKMVQSGGDPTKKPFRFTIVECTRGSKGTQHTYEGTRKELSKPVEVSIKGKSKKDNKVITYRHVNKLRKVKKNELKNE